MTDCSVKEIEKLINETVLDLRNKKLNQLCMDDLMQILKSIRPGIATLDLCGNDLGLLKMEDLIKFLQAIPASISNLDLSNNWLWRKNTVELLKIIKAIPLHFNAINLNNNKLFVHKSSQEIDIILKALGDHPERYTLANNGESDIARALAPITELVREGKILKDIAMHILWYLDISKAMPAKSRYPFFAEQLSQKSLHIDKILNNREKIRLESLNAIPVYIQRMSKYKKSHPIKSFFRKSKDAQEIKQAKALENQLRDKGCHSTQLVFNFLNDPKRSYGKHSSASFLRHRLYGLDFAK